nr:tRNA adenosine(34) deaminase TadA [Desulfonema ishimotonii]
MTEHEKRMQLAIEQARKAAQAEEVPVGAVLIDGDGEVLAAACNRTIGLADPTGHAEILALRQAAQKVRNYRLLNTSLYVTIEPCVMCMGAVIHARVSRVIFGAYDHKWGAAGSLYDFAADARLNHRAEVIPGICEAECRKLMQDFFRARRRRSAK